MNKIFFNFYRIIKSIFSRKKEIPNIDNIQDYLTLEKEKVVIGVMIIFLLDTLYLAFGREGIPLYMVISCTAAFIICLISIIYIFLDKYYTGQLIMNYGSVILWFIHFMYMLISGQSDYRFPVATTYLFTIIMMYAIVSNYIFLDKKHGLISGFIAILFMIISMFIIGKKKYFDNMISPFVFIIVLTIIIWYFINIFNTIFKKLIELKDNLQIEVKKRTAELERLSKLKNYFLANVNHEMRTPLNSIIGYSNIIDSNEISDENKKYLSNIRKSSASLLRIIDDILDITKIEAGQIDIENKVFNLKDEIENIKFNFSEKLKSKLKDINFKVNVNSEVPEFIETDPVRLNQIINNLLVNSFKYTEKGEISLTAIFEYDNENRDSGTLIIEISDTGIGIHESEAERIFEKFERLKMKEDYYNIDKSAGLGLAIVKQIAEKINGEIRLTSALNKGSKFTVEIKKIKVHQSLNECYSVGNINFEKIKFKNQKILLIEDNTDCQYIIGNFLKKIQLDIFIANNGKEGTEKAESIKPELILLDAKLPDINGLEVLKQIYSYDSLKKIPVILVSASLLKNQEYEYFESGIKAFLRKPIDMDKLINELKNYLSFDDLEKPTLLNKSDKELLKKIIFKNFKDEYDELIQTNSIDKIEAFAVKIKNMDEAKNNAGIAGWADSVISCCAEFDIEELQKLLSIFSGNSEA